MQNSLRSRLILWLLTPLLFGAIFGVVTSKLLWNYFWNPPTVQVETGARPVTLTMFRTEPTRIYSLEDRNASLVREFRNCRTISEEDCAFGRVLLALAGDRWLQVPTGSADEFEPVLAAVRQTPGVPFLLKKRNGFGIVATYSINDDSRILAAFETDELHDDTHGYVESLFNRASLNGTLERLGSVYYYFDIAGIEFATSKVLVVSGVVLAYIFASLIFVVTKIFRIIIRFRSTPQ